MKLEMLTEEQRKFVQKMEYASDTDSCWWSILADLTDRLHAETARRVDAEKVVQWAEEGMSPGFMRLEASNYRKLHNVTGWEKPNSMPTAKDSPNE